jgi:hypothetical protein
MYVSMTVGVTAAPTERVLTVMSRRVRQSGAQVRGVTWREPEMPYMTGTRLKQRAAKQHTSANGKGQEADQERRRKEEKKKRRRGSEDVHKDPVQVPQMRSTRQGFRLGFRRVDPLTPTSSMFAFNSPSTLGNRSSPHTYTSAACLPSLRQRHLKPSPHRLST